MMLFRKKSCLADQVGASFKPGVLVSDCRHDATISASPDVVRFEIVKADNVFKVPELLRRFYQAEVLVLPPPDYLPRRKNGKKADTSSPSLPPPCTKESKEQRTRTERIEKNIDSSLDVAAARVLAPGRPCLGNLLRQYPHPVALRAGKER